MSAAVSEFLGNVTVGEAERDAELRSWLEGNFLSKEDMQRQLEKVCYLYGLALVKFNSIQGWAYGAIVLYTKVA